VLQGQGETTLQTSEGEHILPEVDDVVSGAMKQFDRALTFIP
jgi:hypothetical protein